MKKVRHPLLPRTGLTAKPRRKRIAPCCEEADFRILYKGFQLFGLSLQRRAIGFGCYNYWLGSETATTPVADLQTARKTLGALWEDWGHR